jgi:hypothetical protein
MDLSKLDFSEAPAQKMHLTHPVSGDRLKNDDGEDIVIYLYGSDSDRFRSAVRSFGNKRLNAKKNAKQSIEELEETTARILAIATAGWENIVLNGKEVDYSEKNAFELYKDYSWIREQADEFVNERSNFLINA